MWCGSSRSTNREFWHKIEELKRQVKHIFKFTKEKRKLIYYVVLIYVAVNGWVSDREYGLIGDR